ncbi:MAG: DUF2332 domain-containing protein [Caldilineaceae bacterium]
MASTFLCHPPPATRPLPPATHHPPLCNSANAVYTTDMALISDQLDTLAQRYARFCSRMRGHFTTYSFLAAQIAQDREILTLALACRPGQPPGNLLLGAVHYLLLQKPEDPLAAYYPSLTVNPSPVHEAYPAFKRFCLEHQLALEGIVATHLVQTNEIRRCTYLLPAFAYIAQRTAHQGVSEPLALLEIGASAGLNLLWDRYRYFYQHHGQLVEAGALSVLLVASPRGADAGLAHSFSTSILAPGAGSQSYRSAQAGTVSLVTGAHLAGTP